MIEVNVAGSCTFQEGWASGMDQGINALECFSVITRVKGFQLERLELAASVGECLEEDITPPWTDNGANCMASLKQLGCDVSTNESSGTSEL